ncbi:hypothetical protein [Burkholderia ubonensis]|uniref:hypothetical protein n=1 Tax=Burkholderia ubonensis TaxID=101571 RepID=UPI00075EE55E|nr:hypothetical protein [Burkholderia ubonensis]
MTPERILEIANYPETPKFNFGSEALDDWTRKHRNAMTGECHTHSGWYVVRHRSLNQAQRPDHLVLSCWNMGKRVPLSYDVPRQNQD